VMSPRPGRIIADFANPLARPRGLDALTEPAFVDLKRQILHLLHGGDQ
jgi:NitT/TauT family transport system ATP-binding protein